MSSDVQVEVKHVGNLGHDDTSGSNSYPHLNSLSVAMVEIMAGSLARFVHVGVL